MTCDMINPNHMLEKKILNFYFNVTLFGNSGALIEINICRWSLVNPTVCLSVSV